MSEPEPDPNAIVQSPLGKDVVVPETTIRTVPNEIVVSWLTNVLKRDGNIHEAAVKSVTYSAQTLDGKQVAQVGVRREDGSLFRAPAADLQAAAAALAAAETMEAVAVIFSGIVSEGVVAPA